MARSCVRSKRRAVEAHADAAPAERRVVFRVLAHVGQHLVAADVERAEDDGLACCALDDGAIDLGLPVEPREGRRHHELKLGAEEADTFRARLLELRQIIGQARVHLQRNALAINRERRASDERAVLALLARPEAHLVGEGLDDVARSGARTLHPSCHRR